MNVFLDTEFTTLDAQGDLRLISIACVAEDGRSFYAELTDTWNKGLCSQFVIDVVLPLLEGEQFQMKEVELAIKLQDWIESLGDNEVVLRTDAPSYDWEFVRELFTFYGNWPKNLRRQYGTIWFEESTQRHRYNVALYDYFKTHKRQHNALVDAKAMRHAWHFAHKIHSSTTC